MASQFIGDLGIAGRLFKKSGLPTNLIFFVTSRCNLLCTHCFYWEELNKKKDELSLEEIERITLTLPNLLSVSLTGGEPYLRKDLPDIAALFEQNSHVRNIQIPSNGFLVERTALRVEEILKRVRRAKVCTGVSLDGPEEIHNRIRQNPHSFERATHTLRELKKLKRDYKNLSVGIALTVSAANQHVLDQFFCYLTEEMQPDAVTITLARGNPLDASLKEVDPKIYQDFSAKVIQYRRSRSLVNGWTDQLVVAKEEETYRLINQAARATRRVSSCYAGELIGILSETGEVYLCETLNRSMGNIRDFDCDFGKLWGSAQAKGARQYQKDLGCQCTYECAMSVNTLFNPVRALRIAANAARSKLAR